MKRLAASAETVIGVLVEDVGPGGKPMIWLRPADKRARYDFAVADTGDANIGDLVRAEPTGPGPAIKATVVDSLGAPFASNSSSRIVTPGPESQTRFGAQTPP